MKKCAFLCVILFVIFCISVHSAEPEQNASYLSIKLAPGAGLPLGDSTEFFKLGGAVGLSGTYRLPFLPLLTANAELGYSLQPLQAETGESVSILSFGGGAGAFYNFSKLILQAYASGGGYVGSISQGSGFSSLFPYISGGIGVSYLIMPSLSVGIEGWYKNFLGLSSGVNVTTSIAYHFKATEWSPKPKKPKTPKTLPERPVPLGQEVADQEGLAIGNIEFETVFPVLFKYYDENPIGTAILQNNESSPISNIKVSVFVKQYMDGPKICKTPDELDPGETADIVLNALFTDKVLSITEGTKVATQLLLQYTLNGEPFRKTIETTLRLYDRNSLTWDDDRKVAAFVTAKDPDVLSFSKFTAGIAKNKGSKAINENLRLAMGMHEALALYGMAYVVDPRTPYAEFSEDQLSIDFLQFPRHTLQYRAGDCDDLSILYNALLTSVGVETAFITVPGHIFVAFSVDMTPDEARRSFLRADELIFRDNKTWIPVEATEIDGGFLKAWEIGAKQWREHSAREQAGFYPVNDAWKLFEPVGLPDAPRGVDPPNRDKITARYLEEVIRFIDREIYPQVAKIQAEISKSNGSPKAVNRLGVLFSKYGLYDRAEREFNKVLAKQEYVPSMVNLGNLYYLNKDFKKALDFYERAAKEAPDNPKVMLCVARVNHELENYGSVRTIYNKLKVINPDLAIQFAYLDLRGDEASRAADIGKMKEIVLWDEEE